MTLNRKFIVLILFVIGFALTLGISQNQLKAADPTPFEKIKKSGILRIGTEGTYKPFTYHDESDKLVGYDVEVAEAIAQALGLKAEFQEFTWEALLASLDTGKVDVVLNQVGLTEERKLKYNFTNPYLYSYPALITKKDNDTIKSFDQAKGKKTSLNISSNYALIAERFGMEITPSETFSKDIELLLAGRTDVVINNTMAVNDYLLQKPETPIKISAILDEPDLVCIPIVKGDEAFVKAVNEVIEKLRSDGTLAKISQKYLNKDFSKPLSVSDL